MQQQVISHRVNNTGKGQAAPGKDCGQEQAAKDQEQRLEQ